MKDSWPKFKRIGTYEFYNHFREGCEEPLKINDRLYKKLYDRYPEIKREIGDEYFEKYWYTEQFERGPLNNYDLSFSGQRNDLDVRRWYLIDNDELIIEGPDYEIFLDKRISNKDYWPSEEETLKRRKDWPEIFIKHMKEYASKCKEYGDYLDHYLYAKRRYGIKNNPFCRLAYMAGIDPEGRYRCSREWMPEYIFQALERADIEVGLMLGAKRKTLKEEYRSA